MTTANERMGGEVLQPEDQRRDRNRTNFILSRRGREATRLFARKVREPPSRETGVKTLARYLEVIVDPTFDDFYRDPSSIRLAYLACVAIFHAVDRAAEESKKSSAAIRQKWGKESMEFHIVDILAHHFKHVQSSAEKIPPNRPGIPIGLALGFDKTGEKMDLRNI